VLALAAARSVLEMDDIVHSWQAFAFFILRMFSFLLLVPVKRLVA
jgi:hypothetical protein